MFFLGELYTSFQNDLGDRDCEYNVAILYWYCAAFGAVRGNICSGKNKGIHFDPPTIIIKLNEIVLWEYQGICGVLLFKDDN